MPPGRTLTWTKTLLNILMGRSSAIQDTIHLLMRGKRNVWASIRQSLFLLVCLFLWSLQSVHNLGAQSRDEAETVAHLLAVLFDAGRVVVDRNEGLIDDPHKGPKGFTPEVFEQQIKDEFQRRTGIDLSHVRTAPVPPLAKELLPMLLQASKDVVADAQLVINQRGVGYKNFIPATFGSRTAARFSTRSHVQLKQTTLRPRNPKNAPDAYETEVLKRWSEARGTSDETPTTQIETTQAGALLRVLTPVLYQPHCLACHGEPAGALDVSGFQKEGAHTGDLAGAISIAIPLRPR